MKNFKTAIGTLLFFGLCTAAYASATIHAAKEMKDSLGVGGKLHSYITSADFSDGAIRLYDTQSSSGLTRTYSIVAQYMYGNGECAWQGYVTSTSNKSCYISRKNNNNEEVWDFGVLNNDKISYNFVSNFQITKSFSAGGYQELLTSTGVTQLIEAKKADAYANPTKDQLWRIRFYLYEAKFKKSGESSYTTPIENTKHLVHWDYKIPSKPTIYQKSLTKAGSSSGENRNVTNINNFVLSRDNLTIGLDVLAADTVSSRFSIYTCRYANLSSSITKCAWRTGYKKWDNNIVSQSTHKASYEAKLSELGVTEMDSSVTIYAYAKSNTHKDYNSSFETEDVRIDNNNTIKLTMSHLVKTKKVDYGYTRISLSNGDYFFSTAQLQAEEQPGKTAQFKAIANTGYKFVGWYDKNNTYISNESIINVRVLKDTLLYPKFAATPKTGNLWVSYYRHNGEISTCDSYATTCAGSKDHVIGKDSIALTSLFTGENQGIRLKATLYAQIDNQTATAIETKYISAVNLNANGSKVTWDGPKVTNAIASAKSSISWYVSYGYDEENNIANTPKITINQKYRVSFTDYTGQKIEENSYSYNASVYEPENTPVPQDDENVAYTYKWEDKDKDLSMDKGGSFKATTTANFNQVLIESAYMVTFADYDGTELKKEFVSIGSSATPPETNSRDGYVFKSWDGNYTNVTEPTTVTAVYAKIPSLAFSFDTEALVGENSAEDINVTVPSNCFSVEKKIMDGEVQTSEPFKYSHNYDLQLAVSINTEGECADDQSVSEWLAINGTNGTCTPTLNGSAIEVNACSEDSYSQNGFVLNYNFTTPNLVEKFVALTITTDKDGNKFAELDDASESTEEFNIPEDIKNVNVTIKRTFPTGTYSTVMFPFTVNTSDIEGISEIFSYDGPTTDEKGKLAVGMNQIWSSSAKPVEHINLEAYTPYMIIASSETFEVKKPVTIEATKDKIITRKTSKNGVWEFRATYNYKTWTETDEELGFAYGFAAGSNDEVKVGDFVKVAAGAWIRPMRAYLLFQPYAQKVNSYNPEGAKYALKPSGVDSVLPDTMNVVIIKKDGQTTTIGSINMRTGEFRMNRDFDIKGRKVNGMRKVRGAYYGRKVLK